MPTWKVSLNLANCNHVTKNWQRFSVKILNSLSHPLICCFEVCAVTLHPSTTELFVFGPVSHRQETFFDAEGYSKSNQSTYPSIRHGTPPQLIHRRGQIRPSGWDWRLSRWVTWRLADLRRCSGGGRSMVRWGWAISSWSSRWGNINLLGMESSFIVCFRQDNKWLSQLCNQNVNLFYRHRSLLLQILYLFFFFPLGGRGRGMGMGWPV